MKILPQQIWLEVWLAGAAKIKNKIIYFQNKIHYMDIFTLQARAPKWSDKIANIIAVKAKFDKYLNESGK